MTLPAVPRHEALRVELRQRARNLEADFLAFAAAARDALDGQLWALWGFATPGDWVENDLGMSFRSLLRRLTVLDAVDGLPEPARGRVAPSMAELGSTKAAIVAPLLRAQPEGWEDLLDEARALSVSAVQDAVNTALARPQRPPEDPGARARRSFLAHLPPEEVEPWGRLLDVLEQGGGSPWPVIRAAVEVELAAKGVRW